MADKPVVSPYPDPDFDPKTGDAEAILKRAKALVGRSPAEFLPRTVRENKIANKGQFGLYVEAYFNIRANSESAPDFTGAGIELKVVPVLPRSQRGRIRTKERTYVSTIDFVALITQTWLTASVRPKLSRILFVFYEYRKDVPVIQLPVLGILEWVPDPSLLAQLGADWAAVHAKVMAGLAHELSERDTRILGAATKGPGGEGLVKQPKNSVGAKPRAWALKSALTTSIYAGMTARHVAEATSVYQAIKAAPTLGFESLVLSRFKPLVGRPLDEIQREFGIKPSTGKAAQARLIRRVLGIVNDRGTIKEFAERGIIPKVVPVAPNGMPYEAMSFAGFKHTEIIDEEWSSSSMMLDLDRILMIPLQRPTRSSNRHQAILLPPIFWSPTDRELEAIHKEWERFRDLIRAGKANNLPKPSDTQYIHVRPKARNGKDKEPAPGGIRVVKKAFWLNQQFVADILRGDA